MISSILRSTPIPSSIIYPDPLWPFVSLTLGLLITAVPLPTSAQITSDRTLPTPSQLTTDGTRDLIAGGTSQGNNLFHSFLEFNIDEGQQVYFTNPNGIDTILSRVTGGDRSNILGTLGVDGPADLFLLNPNGIVFGPNARLDVNGSFYSSTASQLTFEDGSVFSAAQPENSLLTISAPLGLQYGQGSFGRRGAGEAGEAIASAIYSDTSGDISNQGQLEVPTGQRLMLVGDRVSHSGSLTAPGGRISLIANQLNVTGPAILDGAGRNGTTGTLWLESTGEITIRDGNGSNPSEGLAEKVLESLSGNTNVMLRAGDRILLENLTDNTLAMQSGSGAIHFIADSDGDGVGVVEMQDRRDTVQTVGRGVAIAAAQLDLGHIDLGHIDMSSSTSTNNATNSGSITLTSTHGPIRVRTLIAAGTNRGGDIDVDAGGHFIVKEAITTTGAQGNSGDVNIAATGDIRFRPNASLLMEGLLAGDLHLESDRDIIVQGGLISQRSTTTEEEPIGRGGGFDIRGRSLHLRDGAQLVSATLGSAALKPSRVNLEQSLTIGGFNSLVPANPFGLLATQVATGATGQGGNLRVESETMEVRDAAVLATRTFGLGNAGNLTVIGDEVIVAGAVDVSDNPLLQPGGETLFESELSTEAERESEEVLFLDGVESDDPFALEEANAGDMRIRVRRLRVEDGGEVSAGTHSRGNGGNFTLIAEEVIVTGQMLGEVSELGTETVPEFLGSRPPEGDAGNLKIRSDRLIVTNGGAIEVATMALGGNAGTIDIRVRELEVGGGFILDGAVKNSSITSAVLDPEAEGVVGDRTRDFGGEGGAININADMITLWGGGQIVASTGGNGPSGDVAIAARLINIDGALMTTPLNPPTFSEHSPRMLGGQTPAPSPWLSRSVSVGRREGWGGVRSSTRSTPLNPPLLRGETLAPSPWLSRSVSVGRREGWGGVRQNARNNPLSRMTEFEPLPSGIFASSDVEGQAAGNISIAIGDQLILSDTATIAATTLGNEGNITISGGTLLMTDGSQITTNAAGDSTGGNITFDVDNLIATPEFGNSDITANAEDGSGGQIQIQTRSPILGFQVSDGDIFRANNQTPADTPTNDITAFSQFNPTIDVGTVTIEPPEVDDLSEVLELPSLVDASDRIAAGCPAQQGNTFTVVSQGGLPADPRRGLRGMTIAHDFRLSPNAEAMQTADRRPQNSMPPSLHSSITPLLSAQITEAQTWITMANGNISLVTSNISSRDNTHSPSICPM